MSGVSLGASFTIGTGFTLNALLTASRRPFRTGFADGALASKQSKQTEYGQ